MSALESAFWNPCFLAYRDRLERLLLSLAAISKLQKATVDRPPFAQSPRHNVR